MGRPSRKDRAPYDLDALTDVAVAVFNQRGYDGASLDDVARAAGITKGSIYFHASGKEELLSRAVRRALDDLFAVLDEPDARQGAPLERVRYVMRRTVEILLQKPREVALLLRVRGNTQTERWAMSQRRKFDELIAAMVGEAIVRKELSAEFDPRLTVRLLFGMINSVTEWYRPEHRGNARQIWTAIDRLAFKGLH